MKPFNDSDVQPHGAIPNCGRIYAERDELLSSPLGWQKCGLIETRSGYGRKLTTTMKINFNGKLYRIYCTCFSNAGSYWFISKGRKIFVH